MLIYIFCCVPFNSQVCTFPRALIYLHLKAIFSIGHQYLGYNIIALVFFLGGGLHPWHIEVPNLGVKSELQLLAYSMATAMQDLYCICDVHHSS